MAFKAQRSSTCIACKDPIVAGDLISWSRKNGGAWHAICLPPKSAPLPKVLEDEGKPDRLAKIEDALGALAEAMAEPSETQMDWDEIKKFVSGEIEKSRAAFLGMSRSLEIKIEPTGSKTKFDLAHEHLETLIKLLNVRSHGGQRLNVYMHGPAGSGKSTAGGGALNLAKLGAVLQPWFFRRLIFSLHETRDKSYRKKHGVFPLGGYGFSYPIKQAEAKLVTGQAGATVLDLKDLYELSDEAMQAQVLEKIKNGGTL